MGLSDLWAELTRDPDDINWQAQRAHQQMFVYDSGCLHCHTKLLMATQDKPQTGPSHKVYADGTPGVNCASCHPGVGHHNLSEEFNKIESKG